MEHATRAYVRKNFDQDPAHYKRLSERLASILQEFEGRWDEMVAALQGLVQETLEGRQQVAGSGLDPVQEPFFDLIRLEVAGDQPADDQALDQLRSLTVEIVDHIRQEVALVGFWSKPTARDGLRGWIIRTLDEADVLSFSRLESMADKLMELARANHHRLVA